MRPEKSSTGSCSVLVLAFLDHRMLLRLTVLFAELA